MTTNPDSVRVLISRLDRYLDHAAPPPGMGGNTPSFNRTVKRRVRDDAPFTLDDFGNETAWQLFSIAKQQLLNSLEQFSFPTAQIIKGKIAKLTNFGAFVELEDELEGLLHISELADHKIDKPQDVVQPGVSA